MKDVQNTQDTRNVDIQKVGIKNVELPLIIQRKMLLTKSFMRQPEFAYHFPEITKELT